MDRRVGGLALLLVAALVALIVPRLLNPGVKGQALRAPLPAPPPVGSCLFGAELTVVACGEPHDREVAQAWDAGDPNRPDEAECGDSAAAYVGDFWTAPSGWYAGVLDYFPALIKAPTDQSVAGRKWEICVVQPPLPGTYLGSVRGVTGQRPAEFGICFTGDGQSACSAPHAREVLAYTSGFEPSDPAADIGDLQPLPSNAQLQTTCEQMATAVMRRPVTSSDRVAATINLSQTEPGLYSTGAGLAVFGSGTIAECSVMALAGMELTDTVVGIGDDELPLR